MGSHYIPVGKLKIDKELLDLACPAAGYGNTPPPPEIYCPVNGYIPDPEIYIPPINNLDEFPDESVTFICNATIANWRDSTNGYEFEISNGSYLYELFDINMSLLNSWVVSEDETDFDFPTNDRYYVVRVSPDTKGEHITRYFIGSSAVNYDSCVEAIIFNATNLTAMNFIGSNNLKSLDFKSTLENLTSFSDLLKNTRDYKYFKFPAGPFTSLASVFSPFGGSKIVKLDLRETELLPAASWANFVDGCADLLEFYFPETFHGTSLYQAFRSTARLKICQMFTSAPNMGSGAGNCYDQLFVNSTVEGEINLPACDNATSLSSTFDNCLFLEKVILEGSWVGLTSMINTFANSPLLKEVQMPRTLRSDAIVSGTPCPSTCKGLKKYIGPDIGYIDTPDRYCESITGEHDTSGMATYPDVYFNNYLRSTLNELQMVKLRVSRLRLGYTSASYRYNLLTSMEIDWANSDFSSTSSPQCLLNAAFDATELNRIMSALPTVTAGQVLDIRYCTGYATCDKTIAQNKGWTVL